MAIGTLGNLLDRGRSFELRLEQYYSDIRDGSRDPGVRLLTFYLARHRRHHELATDKLDKKSLESLRRVELRSDIDFVHEKHFHTLSKPPAAVTGDELLRAAVNYDSALVSLYRSILEKPLPDDGRAVLESLICIEERDIVMLKKMLAMHYF